MRTQIADLAFYKFQVGQHSTIDQASLTVDRLGLDRIKAKTFLESYLEMPLDTLTELDPVTKDKTAEDILRMPINELCKNRSALS